MRPLGLVGQARMRERLSEEERVSELVADLLFDGIHGADERWSVLAKESGPT